MTAVYTYTAPGPAGYVLVVEESIDDNGERVEFVVRWRDTPYDAWSPPEDLVEQ